MTTTHSNEIDRIRAESKAKALMKENAQLSDEVRALHHNEADYEEAAREVRNFLLRAEEDKKRLSQRIEKLTANERVLISEVERLKRHSGLASSPGSRPQSQKRVVGTAMTEYIAGLEHDRDYWKGQVELLSQMLASPSVTGLRNPKPPGRVSMAPRVIKTRAQRDGQRSKIEEELQTLQEDRREARQMKCRPNSGSNTLMRSRSLPRQQSCEDAVELQKLRLERDELRTMLNRFEKRIQGIQDNVQNLTKERDNLQKLYSDAKSEIHRLHHDLYDVQSAANRSAASQETIGRLQAELERCRREVTQLNEEKESLMAKFKTASEMENADKQRHSKQMDYLEKALCEANHERDEVAGRINQLKRRLEELQCNQAQIEQRLNERNEKLKKCKEETSSLRSELDAKQRLLEETEAKLATSRHRNGELESVCQRFEKSLEEVTRDLQAERETNRILQTELQATAHEREKMKEEIEELARTKAHLQKSSKYVEKKYMATLTERDEVNSSCNRLAADIRSLEQKLRSAEAELASCTSKLELERAANESLNERYAQTERRLEESEFRGQSLANQLRDIQDVRFQLERQIKSMAENMERLRANVERLAGENEALLSSLEAQTKEKTRLETNLEDSTSANRQLVRDRDEINHRHNVARERISELEADLRSMEVDLKHQTEATSKEQKLVFDLRRENESLRQRCEAAEAETAEAAAQHRNAEERVHQAEVRASQLERELRLEHDDYLQIRSRLEATEEQRDAEEANRKVMAQRISELESQLTAQLLELKETRSSLDEVSRALTRKEEQLMTSQAAEQSVRSELAAAQSSLRESRRALDAGEQESSRIRDELATAMRDLHRLQTELHETADDREALKARADGYLAEIARQERLLAERTREHELMADQARTAAADADVWRTRWSDASAAAAEARLRDDERAAEVSRLRDTLEARKREIVHCRAALDKAEEKIASLTHRESASSEAAGQARAEVSELVAEAARLRESLARSEAACSTAERAAASARLALEAAEKRAASAEADAAYERENARKANALLQAAQEKQATTTQEIQERTNEVMALRERAVIAEERAEAKQRESARLFERLAEVEKSSLVPLSRSHSIERFERDRDRLSSELRSLPPTYRASAYSGSAGRYTTSRLRSPRREREEL